MQNLATSICRAPTNVVVLVCAGERLTDVDVDTILKLTGTEEDLDGNIKYEGSPLIFRLCDPLLDLPPMHTHDTRYY